MIQPSILWPGYYDVVILPPSPVREVSLKLSERLHRIGGEWQLGKREFLPHISLYHIPVHDKDLEPFLNEVQKIANTTRWGSLQTTGFDMPVIMVSKPAWLKDLHQRILRRTVQFVNWNYRPEITWSLHRFSGRSLEFAKKYMRRYGTPMVGMNFLPHITLSSFKNGDPADIVLEVRRMSFRADRIHVCELGQSHTCHRIIRELPFRS